MHDGGVFSMRYQALSLLEAGRVWFAKMTWRIVSEEKI
jgi:hypothetical protein